LAEEEDEGSQFLCLGGAIDRDDWEEVTVGVDGWEEGKGKGEGGEVDVVEGGVTEEVEVLSWEEEVGVAVAFFLAA